MKLSDFIKALAPIEGIPVKIYSAHRYTTYNIDQCIGFKCYYYDDNGNQRDAFVKCIRDYYTDDPDGKKRLGAKTCDKIQRNLFDKADRQSLYLNCVLCHSKCFEMLKKEELFFLHKRKNK